MGLFNTGIHRLGSKMELPIAWNTQIKRKIHEKKEKLYY